MAEDRAPGKIIEGMKVSDSYLTDLANNIARGALDRSIPKELNRQEKDVENIVKNAKLQNAEYKRQINDDLPAPYTHLLQTGQGIIDEIKLLQDKYLDNTLGEK